MAANAEYKVLLCVSLKSRNAVSVAGIVKYLRKIHIGKPQVRRQVQDFAVRIPWKPSGEPGWTTVTVKAASLNQHDVWTLRGVGISPDRLPMVLGCDAAGVDEEGNEVVVHGVLGDPSAGGGDETLDPYGAPCCPSAMTGRSRSGWPCPGGTCCPSPRRCPSRRRPACRRPT